MHASLAIYGDNLCTQMIIEKKHDQEYICLPQRFIVVQTLHKLYLPDPRTTHILIVSDKYIQESNTPK